MVSFFLQVSQPIQAHRLVTMRGEHSGPAPFELTSPVTSVQTEDKGRKNLAAVQSLPRDAARKRSDLGSSLLMYSEHSIHPAHSLPIKN